MCYNHVDMKPALPELPPTQRKKTSKLAITSLVLRIISPLNFIFFPTGLIIPPIFNTLFAVPSVIAFVFGIIAVNKIRKSSYLKGMGLAIAGLILATPMILYGIVYGIGFIFMVALH